MVDHIAALRAALAGRRTAGPASDGFRLVVEPPTEATVAVAALGPRMLDVAGGHADAVVANLLPPSATGALVARVAEAAAAKGRPSPKVAAWMIVGDLEVSGPRVTRLLRPYLSAAGYAGVLADAGVTQESPPREVLRLISGLGPPEAAVQRAQEYMLAGVEEIVAVVSARDATAARSIAALASIAYADPDTRPSEPGRH
jgi:alkanesulfonate monooxygenase SsuD/methylene tetrahydromethanopterin reductase-like flavin-dependent oxidoreductase (luciferase family)